MSYRVFYVDDQEDIVWSTTRLLARERSDLTIEGFTEPVAALEALELQPPDVLVTDLRMEGLSGLELLVAARKVVPDLPVIVVTAYGGPDVTAALHGRSLVEYLEKPVRTESLIASIDRLLVCGEGFSGAISLPMLPDLIQVYTLSLTTGALDIRRGRSAGTIWFDSGKIVHAICGDRSGEPAVYELLSWQGGEFSLDTETKPKERTITATWQEVLMEGCRRLDEVGRDVTPAMHPEDAEEDVPSTQVAVPVDFVPRALTSSSAHSDPPARQRQTSDSPADPVVMDSQESAPPLRGHSMATDERLNQLAIIEGFVGAAVFDGAATSLVGAASSIDLKAAVAGNAEVLAGIHHTLNDLRMEDSIADVVIRLREQFHLIRPVSQREGMFVYLVLDRRRGDLAKARLQLAEAEQLLGG